MADFELKIKVIFKCIEGTNLGVNKMGKKIEKIDLGIAKGKYENWQNFEWCGIFKGRIITKFANFESQIAKLKKL